VNEIRGLILWLQSTWSVAHMVEPMMFCQADWDAQPNRNV